MDLSDERFHKRRVPWEQLVNEGYDVRQVMIEAQKQGLHRLARVANDRIRNQEWQRMRSTPEVEAVLRVREDKL
tara:strand:+ start:14129 stop:14350 length:222 start_codon:yes stop_codon:yes gene_type:complete